MNRKRFIERIHQVFAIPRTGFHILITVFEKQWLSLWVEWIRRFWHESNLDVHAPNHPGQSTLFYCSIRRTIVPSFATCQVLLEKDHLYPSCNSESLTLIAVNPYLLFRRSMHTLTPLQIELGSESWREPERKSTFSPSSVLMNPAPVLALNHLTVP